MLLHLFLIFISLTFMLPDDSEWKKSLEKDEITVYTRKSATSKFHEFRAETLMEGSLDRFKEIISDVDGYVSWQPDCKAATLIERKNENDFIYHMDIKVPFPFEKRDMVQQIQIAESTNRLTVQIISRPEKVEEQKKCVRMVEADGTWELTVLPSGKIKVDFQYHGNPGGDIPAWLVNSFVVKSPHQSLKNIRKLMSE